MTIEIRGNGRIHGVKCSDCHGAEVDVLHNGEFVPEGTAGGFCNPCWKLRKIFLDLYGFPKPLASAPAAT